VGSLLGSDFVDVGSVVVVVGTRVGQWVGLRLGSYEGSVVVGTCVGQWVGLWLGSEVESKTGASVGAAVLVGWYVGDPELGT